MFTFVMAVWPRGIEWPGAPSDKVQHVAAFVTLASLATWAYPRTALISIAAGLSIFGALIEMVQAIPVLNRDSDVIDWIADSLAAASALSLVWLRRRRTSRLTAADKHRQ